MPISRKSTVKFFYNYFIRYLRKIPVRMSYYRYRLDKLHFKAIIWWTLQKIRNFAQNRHSRIWAYYTSSDSIFLIDSEYPIFNKIQRIDFEKSTFFDFNLIFQPNLGRNRKKCLVQFLLPTFPYHEQKSFPAYLEPICRNEFFNLWVY